MLTYACLLEPLRPTSPPPVLADQHHSGSLCAYCENIATNFREISPYLERGERKRRVKYTRLDSYPDFPNLRTAAEHACSCCALLRYTIRKNWSRRPFTEYGVGDLDDGTPLYSGFLATEWDGEVRIDDLCFARSSTNAGPIEFLTVRIAPSAYSKIKGFRVIEEHDTIDTLNQISAEFVLKVFKPACSSTDFLLLLRSRVRQFG